MKSSLVLLLLLFALPVHAASITYSSVYNSVNNERISSGLPVLKHSAVLDKVATDRLNDIKVHNYFAHNATSGIEPWYWFKKEHYSYVFAGENLARYFTSTNTLMDGWMSSNYHKQNILYSNYNETGIATDGNIVVEEFGSTSILTSQKVLSLR